MRSKKSPATTRRRLRLPATMQPTGDGSMPLYCAAQWIATKCGTFVFDPTDATIWNDAFEQLCKKIESEGVEVTGIRDGQREKIPGHIFGSIKVELPFNTTDEFLFKNKLFLHSVPYLDDDHWDDIFNDSLQDRRGIKWSQLTVLKSHITRWWPPASTTSLTHTGAAGRPTSRQLVEGELHRRIAELSPAQHLGPSITEVAETLTNWLATHHPDQPPMTKKTVMNSLRSQIRLHVSLSRN